MDERGCALMAPDDDDYKPCILCGEDTGKTRYFYIIEDTVPIHSTCIAFNTLPDIVKRIYDLQNRKCTCSAFTASLNEDYIYDDETQKYYHYFLDDYDVEHLGGEITHCPHCGGVL